VLLGESHVLPLVKDFFRLIEDAFLLVEDVFRLIEGVFRLVVFLLVEDAFLVVVLAVLVDLDRARLDLQTRSRGIVQPRPGAPRGNGWGLAGLYRLDRMLRFDPPGWVAD
jgi:hypothetical protein